jgi:hypothetical protein
VKTPWLPKFSVDVLLIVQVATIVTCTVKVAVEVAAHEGLTDCRREAAVSAPTTQNRLTIFG